MEKGKKYSGLFIIATGKEEAIDEVKNGINSVITDNSGIIAKEGTVVKKRLAYPIKKEKEALYYEIAFDAEPGSVPKMMRQFRINTNILRTIVDKMEQ